MLYQEARSLLIKYKEGDCTDNEKAIVEHWLFLFGEDELDISEETIEAIGAQIWACIAPKENKTVRFFTWKRWAVAASILLLAAAGGYLFIHKNHPTQQFANDIHPGGNNAILTLANGQKIKLTGAKNGKIAQQAGISVVKNKEGELVYKVAPANGAAEVAELVNKAETPNGGQYEIVLADGTKVWLDAASSITYPVSFTGHERKVTITGQAYFEVVHKAEMPFRVVAKAQTIEDIGTHFNINAYDDEPVITTTLLEGAVKLTKDNANVLLKPGQQATITATGNSYKINAADAESAVAWKNGEFSFDHTDLQPLMRQVSRWYDVQVVYTGRSTGFEFMGGINRNTNLSNVLKILQQSGIKFKIEGKKLIVE